MKKPNSRALAGLLLGLISLSLISGAGNRHRCIPRFRNRGAFYGLSRVCVCVCVCIRETLNVALLLLSGWEALEWVVEIRET
jgi:hypothetical protein